MAAVKSAMLVASCQYEQLFLFLTHIIFQMFLHTFLTQCSFKHEDRSINNFLLGRFVLKVITDSQFIVLVSDFCHSLLILMVQGKRLCCYCRPLLILNRRAVEVLYLTSFPVHNFCLPRCFWDA